MREKAGFLLVEFIWSTLLGALILIGAWSVYQQSAHLASKTQKLANALTNAALVQTLLDRDLEQSKYIGCGTHISGKSLPAQWQMIISGRDYDYCCDNKLIERALRNHTQGSDIALMHSINRTSDQVPAFFWRTTQDIAVGTSVLELERSENLSESTNRLALISDCTRHQLVEWQTTSSTATADSVVLRQPATHEWPRGSLVYPVRQQLWYQKADYLYALDKSNRYQSIVTGVETLDWAKNISGLLTWAATLVTDNDFVHISSNE